MQDINQVTIIGRITKDTAIATTKDGTSFVRMSIANSYYAGKGKNDGTNYFNVTLFGKGAEALVQYLVKGQQICINGELRYHAWTDKNGNKRQDVGIMANRIQLVGEKKAPQAAPQEHTDPPAGEDEDVSF